jgi:phage-related protein (TIGR01555 family)
MSRPVGSKNKASIIKEDGYAESFTGAGTNRDRSSFVRAKAAYILQQQELTDLYISDGFARKIVDSVAEEMTRAGIDLEDMEDDTLEDAIESRLDELDALKHFNDSIRWSRLYGGAVCIYGLNDGGTLDAPLNPEGIKSVEFLRVYDRYQATIQTRNTDPTSIDYGKPEMWLISPVVGGSPYQVHNSRLWVFDGEAIPELLRQANLGWGASSLQSCADQLKRVGMGHQYAMMLLERSQQAVHKIPGLANTLRQPGGDAMIQKRVDVVDYVRGVLNTIVIDGEEDYTVTTQPMTGVPDVLDRMAEALSATSNIPVSVLMGKSMGGLANSEKSSMDNWHARIASDQNDILRKPLDLLVTYIIRSLTQDDVEYKLCFKPLVVMSDKEEAEVDKLKADTKKIKSDADVAYIVNGVIDPTEVRKEVGEEYNIEPGSELDPLALTPAEVASV